MNMIPSADEAKALWDVYALPEPKRIHCRLVAQLAVWFAHELVKKDPTLSIDIPLLEASALLHDIDKAVAKLPHERHPDAAVRVLRERGLDKVADVVRTHPLHAILDQTISPKTWEQKLLFLSDKMVKYSIGSVDERFDLWRAEHLPSDAVIILDQAYPKVKLLESRICSMIGVTPDTVSELATKEETSTMKSHSLRRNV
jgi:hypothetical protein